ncbi:NUDIX hydrolase [Penicillium taxi]|uniref:NUDIX hydrolase n=1 Tax=Penicillium taxi TaxID=168475 RepID=UPI002544D842|nr:NUDIX hydrolase [Penicillium taxi]KAJ5899774.1 NUDIX hydrolase [Penicillium taxi]
MVPKVGVGVFVLNAAGQFILGKRKGSIGADTWALAGGNLEFGESFQTCAKREVFEETGLQIHNLKFLTATNHVMADKHYVTVFMVGVVSDPNTQPQSKIMEPEKCTAWEWITWDELRAEGEAQMSSSNHKGRVLFEPLINLFQQRPDLRV